MTWDDLQDLFYESTGDSKTDPEWFAEETIRLWADEALRDLVRDSLCLEARESKMVVSGTAVYDFPDDCEEITRVTYDGEALGDVTKQRLRAGNERWFERSGKPYLYYLSELDDQIGLYEKPDASTTVEAFSYTGSERYGAVVDASGSTRPSGFPYGVVVDVVDASPPGIDVPGAVVDAISGNALEIFYRARPAAINRDENIDMPSWAMHGILWGMLARAYSADTLVQSKEAASAYWHMFNHWKRRLRIRSIDKLDNVWVMGGSPSRVEPSLRSRLPRNIPEPT